MCVCVWFIAVILGGNTLGLGLESFRSFHAVAWVLWKAIRVDVNEASHIHSFMGSQIGSMWQGNFWEDNIP